MHPGWPKIILWFLYKKECTDHLKNHFDLLLSLKELAIT